MSTFRSSNHGRSSSVVALTALVLLGCAGVAALLSFRVAGAPTELMRAAHRGDVDEVQRLLDRGADIDEQRGYSVRVGLLLGHGPPRLKYGETALLYAINGRSREAVRVLLDAGADTEIRDSDGRGMWEYALENLGDTGGQVMLLLANRVPMPEDLGDRILQSEQTGDEGVVAFALGLRHSERARESALCNASRNGNIASMDLLLQTFAKPPPKALDCAVQAWGSFPSERGRQAVDYLMAYGADPNGHVLPAYPPKKSRYSCPLICIDAGELGGCFGGCAAPSSGSVGDGLGSGYWIQGSGPDGKMGSDSRFEIRLRKLVGAKHAECSFAIDARVLGPRQAECDRSFGPARITVMPQ